MDENKMTPQECKKVLKGLHISEDFECEAITYALNLIQEYGELKKEREQLKTDTLKDIEALVRIQDKDLAKYKLRVEKLEKNNKNQHFLIKGYMEQQEALEKIKEQLQSQLSALREKVDVGKIKEVIKGWVHCIATQKPDVIDYEMLANSLVEYFNEKDNT